MTNAFINIGLFLIEVVFSLFTYAVLLRFFLQWVKADFYNPFCQLIIRITSPLLKPLRRVIPGFFGLDFAAILLAYVVIFLQLILVQMLVDKSFYITWAVIWVVAFIKLILNVIWLYIILIVIRSIASWFSHASYNPILLALHQLTEPLLRKARQIIPRTQSGIDFSPTLVLLILICIQIFISSIFSM
ncbi:YggT family protein [Fastidiosibacter lacustris]|uniref:YggT family protein n=1 Tax=Fastidiosibacter lacustris TaxID=2056695 RepID=UPI000E349913|nr:YggT family protein [Fastidiosibacter lacustris]